MTDQQKEAKHCLSVQSEYKTTRDCVLHQRPELLSDPILKMFDIQIRALSDAFHSRVYDIADGNQ